MPTFEDWLNDPISIINNIFSSNKYNFDAKVQEYFEKKLINEKNYYSIPSLNEVPLYEIKPNSLVRYRCMIQDVFNPVYYADVQRIRHKVSGDVCYMSLKYREALDLPDGYEIDGDVLREHLDELRLSPANNDKKKHEDDETREEFKSNLEQRMTFYCVPIPGENKWAKHSYKATNTGNGSTLLSASNNVNRSSKRSMEEENEEPETIRSEEEKENQQQIESTTTEVTKKSRVLENETTEASTAGKKWARAELNFPLGDEEQGHACLVKTYDRFDDFKLNDIVEFVGILSQDPSLAYDEDDHDHHSYRFVGDSENGQQQDAEEEKTETNRHTNIVLSAYPPSLVPRLHCVLWQKLHHNNPLLGRPWSQKNIDEKKNEEKIAKKEKSAELNDYWSKQMDEFTSSLKQLQMGSNTDPLFMLRKEVIDAFQELLLGDSLAAEYLLMHLLSSVFTRKDVTVLGKFALNITNVPALKSDDEEKKEDAENKPPKKEDSNRKYFSDCFFEALQHLVPTSHLFPLTTDNLNKWNLIPNKDYNKDKLISGMLQLPDDFHLCIDETVLNTGQLNQKGLINLNSIGDIIKWQKMNYDFSFHQQEFNTNIRVLVLSNTKSILPFDFQLKLDADISNFDLASYEKLVESLRQRTSFLDNVRRYLTIVSKLDYEMNEHMQKLVENDIVTMRKEEANSQSKNKMSIDDYHLLLVIARLQTLSYGKTQLGLNEWNRAKSLQFERIKRQI